MTRQGWLLILGFMVFVYSVIGGGIVLVVFYGDDSDRDVIWIMALCAVVIAAALGLHPVIRRHTDCSITLAEWRARRQK